MLLKKLKNNPVFYSILCLAIVYYSITAYYSKGFFHADELYQIIEFAGIKLGVNSPNDLAWEYHAKIRPALQPSLCFIIIKSLTIINIHSPFTQAFILRLLTAILALIITSGFISSAEHMLKNKWSKYVFYILSFFTWFIPFLSVRFSSEAWSGLLFLLGLSFLIKPNKTTYTYLVSGIFFGISFLFRLPISVAIITVFIWLIFTQKLILKDYFKFIIGIFLMIVLGIIIDSWFYEELVFTPVELIKEFIKKNTDPTTTINFGTSPWFYYFYNLLVLTFKPIGFLIIASILTLLINKPKNIFVWCFLIFIGFHSIIPHKEERFIFPMLFLIPIIISYAFDLFSSNRNVKRILLCVITICFVINLIPLYAIMVKPADNGKAATCEYIHDSFHDKKINLIHGWWANPFDPWHGFPNKFYSNPNVNSAHIHSLCELNDSLINNNSVNLLIIRKIELELNQCNEAIPLHNFQLIHQSQPKWIECFSKYYRGVHPKNTLLIYEKIE